MESTATVSLDWHPISPTMMIRNAVHVESIQITPRPDGGRRIEVIAGKAIAAIDIDAATAAALIALLSTPTDA